MNDKDLLLAVFAQIERERIVSIPQLARMLGTSGQDIWDALDMLVYSYDTVGIRLELEDNFARLVKPGGEQVLRLTDDETTLLLDMLHAQGYQNSDELPAKLIRAKGSLAAQKTPRTRIGSAAFGDISNVLETVAAACEDMAHRLLHIEYQKEGAAEPAGRDVEPWIITSEGDFRYLQAWCHKAGAWRSFRIDRIKSAELSEETYTPHVDMPDPVDERAEQAMVAHVSFAPGVRLPDWPGLIAASTDEDGSVTAQIPWLGGLWLPKHIVGMFGDCTPLDPPALGEACRAYAQELLED